MGSEPQAVLRAPDTARQKSASLLLEIPFSLTYAALEISKSNREHRIGTALGAKGREKGLGTSREGSKSKNSYFLLSINSAFYILSAGQSEVTNCTQNTKPYSFLMHSPLPLNSNTHNLFLWKCSPIPAV